MDDTNSPRPTLQQYLSLNYIAGGHPLTQVLSQRIGAVLAWGVQVIGLTPNQTTVLAGLIMTAGAWLFANAGSSLANIAVITLLLQLAYAADCADGQLARATKRGSERGAWWDVFMDFYAINLLSFAILYFLLKHQVDVAVALSAVMFFTIGRNLSLFSSTLARSSGGSSEDKVSAPQFIARLLIDTSVVLFLLAVLRCWPTLLLMYLYGMAGLFILHALYVGLRNTRPAQ